MLRHHAFALLAGLPFALSVAACSGEASGGAKVDPRAAAGPAETAEPEPFPREALLNMMSAHEADLLDGERGLLTRTDAAFDGLTLFAPLNSTRVLLIDLDGEVVHFWETGHAPGAWCYLLDDGTLLHCGRNDDDPKFRGGGIGGVLRRLAPDGAVLWRHEISDGERHQHHDVEPMPNGNVLVIQWERMNADDAIAAGRDPRGVGEPGLWPDAVVELKPVGADGVEVVWEWRAADHLVQDLNPSRANHGAIADHPGRIDINAGFEPPETKTREEIEAEKERERQMAAIGYGGGADDRGDEEEFEDEDEDGPPPQPRHERTGDFLHTNAVAYHPGLDLIALSSPELSEVFVIDHSTTTAEAETSSGGRFGKGGELLWRWGNPAMHGAGSEADRRLFYQHDPTWLGGADDLRLLVFNNGGNRQDGESFSEILELRLPFDSERGFTCPPGAACGPAEPAWVYADPDTFYSAFISGSQRLPNGNTLICSGAGGRLFEVDSAGEVVWDYANPHGGDVAPPEHAGKAPPLAVFRATRLPRDHPGVVALMR